MTEHHEGWPASHPAGESRYGTAPGDVPVAPAADEQTPAVQTPDEQTPDEQAPAVQTPDVQTPDVQTPDGGRDPRIASAVARLDALGERPPAEHVEVYEEVHRVLQDALADAARADGGRGGTAPDHGRP